MIFSEIGQKSKNLYDAESLKNVHRKNNSTSDFLGRISKRIREKLGHPSRFLGVYGSCKSDF